MISIKNIINKTSCKGIIILFLMFFISGCSSSLVNIRKEHNARFNEDITNRTGQIISPDRVYDLETCIDIALENNLDIKIAEINGRLANLDRKVAFSYFLPQIDAQFTHTKADKLQMRNTGGGYIAMSDQDTTVTVIQGQMAIFNPETWFMYSAYQKGADIQDLITLRTKQAIRLQVTALYLSSLSIEKNINALETSVEQAQALYREMEAMYREGFILKSEFEESKVYLAMQENNLEEMKRQRIYTKASLLEAMGLSPLSEINLGAPPAISVKEQELSDMMYTAMLNRPELMVADRTIAARGDSVKMAISAFLPKLFLVGDFTSNRDSYLRYRDIFTHGVSAVLTVFDGFANIYEYKAAKQEKAQAMLDREQSCIKIMLEVIEAKQTLDRELENRNLLRLDLEAAKSRFNEVTAMWEEGMISSSDKLDAVSGYETAKANMSMADFRYQVASATMDDVTGITGKE